MTEGSPHGERCRRRVTTETAIANTIPESKKKKKNTYTRRWHKAGQLGLGPGQNLVVEYSALGSPSILENLNSGTETSWLGV